MKEEPKDMTELEASARALLEAARLYREQANRSGVRGAVIWLQGIDGSLVVFTRGEYRDQLMENISMLGGSPIAFGMSEPTPPRGEK